MTRTMYDAVNAENLPSTSALIGAYCNGLYTNMVQVMLRFPRAVVVKISVYATRDAGTVLDVENGNARPDEAPGWAAKRRLAGVDPTVYCNISTWSAVQQAFAAQGVPQPHYWIAHYDGDPTIPPGAVAKQYQNGSAYDTSSVADYWPGVDPVQEDDVPYTPDQMIGFAQQGAAAAIAAERSERAADEVWWLDHALNGTTNPAMSVAQAQAVADIHKLVTTLGDKPAGGAATDTTSIQLPTA